MMRFKILINQSTGKVFTYSTDSYELDDFFIKFVDDRGNKRMFPKTKIEEVIEA